MFVQLLGSLCRSSASVEYDDDGEDNESRASHLIQYICPLSGPLEDGSWQLSRLRYACQCARPLWTGHRPPILRAIQAMLR